MQEKILIIDDDKKLTKLLEEFLGSFNYDLAVKHKPEEGIEFCRNQSVDLVILDIMLPGIDGFQVLRTIREFSTVPVIMLTARGEVTDRIVGLDLGADVYLS